MIQVQVLQLKGKGVFMHYNAPSHVTKLTWEIFKKFSIEKSLSSALNPMENPWSIVKIKLYEDGK